MKEPVGQIRISGRVLHIGHQDYSMANISRVQTFRLAWRGKLATSYPVARIALLLALIGALAVAASALPAARLRIDAGIIATARTAGEILTLIAGARIAYLVGLLLYRLFFRRPRYSLVIETSGTQYTALTGTNWPEIHWIRTQIVNAIESPPVAAQTLSVSGDVVFGDQVNGGTQYKQTGPASTMARG